MITRSNVYILASKDNELEPYIQKDVTIIDGDIALSTCGKEWNFHRFTGKLKDGTPVIDLDKTLGFDVVLDFEEKDVDIAWLMKASLLEIIRKFSK
jgi:hypothetical protein